MLRRIVVIGSSGSGKTTLARDLSARLGHPHVELDALHWEPDWQEAPDELFRARVAEAVAAERWVADGNSGKVRDLVWARADTLVWLDYPLPVFLGRLLRRTAGRIVTGEELWSGNRERLAFVLSRDSVILYALRTYRRRRREYPELLAQPEYGHLSVLRFRSPEETQRWVEGLAVTDNRP